MADAMNVSLDRRLQIAAGGAIEIGELAKALRDQLDGGGEEGDRVLREVVATAIVDRIKAIAEAMQDAASPGDDKQHDDDKLVGSLRFVATMTEASHG